VLAQITLLADGDGDLTYEPRTLRRPAGESRTGKSPRTPSIVSRTNEPKPEDRVVKDLVESLTHAHRFAFYPSAPRVNQGYGLPPG
jgi:hypothetical protein